MKLTQHFALEEFTRSQTAARLGIDNTLNPAFFADSLVIANLKNLCTQVLEPLRRHIDKPIVISSGYRCPVLNRAVGGVANSQHLTGQAADITIPSVAEAREWMRWSWTTPPSTSSFLSTTAATRTGSTSPATPTPKGTASRSSMTS